MSEQILTAMTRHDVSRKLGERPCEDDFKHANGVLPNWSEVAYTPTQMAAHGVKHSSIMWAWLRPEVMTREGMIEAICRMAEEAASPLTNAIAAARECAADPSEENIAAAAKAAEAAGAAAAAGDAAAGAARAAEVSAWVTSEEAAALTALAAWAASQEAPALAAWTAEAARAAGTARKRQVQIIEDVLRELSHTL